MDKLAGGRRDSNSAQSAGHDLERMQHYIWVFPAETDPEIQLLAQSLVRTLAKTTYIDENHSWSFLRPGVIPNQQLLKGAPTRKYDIKRDHLIQRRYPLSPGKQTFPHAISLMTHIGS